MQTTQRVVPTRGAIVRTNYAGNIGLRAFIHLKTPSGREVPFGAMVTLSGAAKSQASIVSDAGMVYMTGLQPTGVLTVSWGEKSRPAMYRHIYLVRRPEEKFRSQSG